MGSNAIVGQSGGPTSVINASLAGVLEACEARGAKTVYGMTNGIQGLLEEKVVDLTEQVASSLEIELLKRTPSSVILRMSVREKTWNPPESVSIGLFHPSNLCKPPA